MVGITGAPKKWCSKFNGVRSKCKSERPCVWMCGSHFFSPTTSWWAPNPIGSGTSRSCAHENEPILTTIIRTPPPPPSSLPSASWTLQLIIGKHVTFQQGLVFTKQVPFWHGHGRWPDHHGAILVVVLDCFMACMPSLSSF